MSAILVVIFARLAGAAEPGRGMRDALGFAGSKRSMDRWLAAVATADSAFRRWTPDLDEPASVGAPMRAAFDGLQYFLSDSLRAEFLGLSSDAFRAEFVRRYWLLRDPTPTTADNERRDEHHRRVEHARTYFNMPRRPYWDARGEFYIRFGAPAAVDNEPAHVRLGLGYVPRRETWFYPATDLQVIFEQGAPGLPYELGNSAVKQTNRRDVLEEATREGYGDASTRTNDDDRVTVAELAPDARTPWLNAWAPGRGAIRAEHITQTTAEMFTSSMLPQRVLPAVLDHDAFRADSARTRVETHLQFNLRDLRFIAVDSVWAACVRVEGVLFDSNLHEVARDAYQETIPVRSRDTAASAILWPAQLAFDVPPGEYRLALRVLDTRDDAAGDFAFDLTVRGFANGRLMLSDVEMATSIETRPDMAESRFAKGTRVVMPNPSAAYATGAPLVVYFEVYGLRADARGERRYTLAYRIEEVTAPSRWPPWKRDPKAPTVESRSVFTSPDEPAEAMRIDVTALGPGTYRLHIALRDELAQTETTADTHFRIIESQQ